MTERKITELVEEIYRYKEMQDAMPRNHRHPSSDRFDVSGNYNDKKIHIRYGEHGMNSMAGDKRRDYEIVVKFRESRGIFGGGKWGDVMVFDAEFIWDGKIGKLREEPEYIKVFRHGKWEEYLETLPAELEQLYKWKQEQADKGMDAERIENFSDIDDAEVFA